MIFVSDEISITAPFRCLTSAVVLGLSVWEPVVGHGFGLGALNRNNYRFPTTNHTMQVFGSDA